MVKIASDYPVTFPFGATVPPYSKASPHTGEDRAMPVGTIVRVGTVDIGLSGGAVGAFGSGQSTGPHLHVQKMVDGQYVHPQGLGLGTTIAFPATAIETGNKSDVGNYVRVLDANNIRWSYFHLSKITTSKGTAITASKGDDMADENFVLLAYRGVLGDNSYKPNDKNIQNYVGKPCSYVLLDILQWAEKNGLDYASVKRKLDAKGATADSTLVDKANKFDQLKELLK